MLCMIYYIASEHRASCERALTNIEGAFDLMSITKISHNNRPLANKAGLHATLEMVAGPFARRASRQVWPVCFSSEGILIYNW